MRKQRPRGPHLSGTGAGKDVVPYLLIHWRPLMPPGKLSGPHISLWINKLDLITKWGQRLMVLGWVPLTKPLSRRAATVSPMPNYQATLKSVVLLCGLNFICFQKTFFLLPPSLLSSVLLFSFLSPPPFFFNKKGKDNKMSLLWGGNSGDPSESAPGIKGRALFPMTVCITECQNKEWL